jgi:hypothetical protein
MSSIELVLVRIEANGRPIAVDQVIDGVCRWGGGPADPTSGKLVTWEAFFELQEQYYCRDWTFSDADTYNEMLEVLPPLFWRSYGGWSVFQMSEYLTGDITATYCWHEKHDLYTVGNRRAIRSMEQFIELVHDLNQRMFSEDDDD